MKKTATRSLALLLTAIVLASLLAACGGEDTDLKGTYSDSTGTVSYVFKDGNVSMSMAGMETPMGEFEVKDGDLYVAGTKLGTVKGNTITVNGVDLKKK